MNKKSNSYQTDKAGMRAAVSRAEQASARDSVRGFAQGCGARRLSFGEWFIFLVAFLISMAWGVLAALAAETVTKPDIAAAPSGQATTQQLPAFPARPRPPADPQFTSFRPTLLVYRQAEGEGFKKPAGVFVDRETGEVLVVDSGNNLVNVFSRDGIPLFSIGYNGEIPQPTQAVTDKQGRIFVLAGSPRKVKVFNYRGEPLGDLSLTGFAGAAQVMPTALTVDRDGSLYIADSASGKILVYDLDGRLVLSFGGRGDGVGSFNSITAMTVDQAGTVYVADALHKPAIQIFDAKGTYVRGWGEHSGGPTNFSLPIGIAVDPLGRVLVADTIRQTISVFSSQGNFLFRFGGLGAFAGALAYPSGIDVDKGGRLYVAEAVNARIQVFEPTTGVGASKAPGLPASGPPPRVRDEIRQGLGEALKEIQK